MTDVVVGTLVNFLAWWVIGLGPALWLFARRDRVLTAVATGPVVGFTITSLAATYLTLLDIPARVWALPYYLVAMLVGAGLCVAAWRTGRLRTDAEAIRRPLLAVGVGLLVTFVLVVTPMALGGLGYTRSRGNFVDASNYQSAANFLYSVPYSWHLTVPGPQLGQLNPDFPLAAPWLNTRWTTMALLASSSAFVNVPIYRFEFGFSLLSILAVFGPFMSLGLLGSVRPLGAALLAIAICAGFWGQLVLDLRAVAQLNVLPVIGLLVLLIARLEAGVQRPYWPEYALLGMVATALMFLYPEGVPSIVVGLGVFFLIHRPLIYLSPRRLIPYLGALVVGAILFVPLATFILRFFASQVSFGTTQHVDWYLTWFSWLYDYPLTAIWGLPQLVTDQAQIWALVDWPVAPVLSVALFVILLVATVVGLLVRGGAGGAILALCAGLNLTTALICTYLYRNGQEWSAGKVLSYGYPFLILAVGVLALAQWQRPMRWFERIGQGVMCGVMYIWLVAQLGLAVYRIDLVTTQQELPGSINQSRAIWETDWDLRSFERALPIGSRPRLEVLVTSNFVAQYLEFAFGSTTDFVLVSQNQQPQDAPGKSYLLVSRDLGWINQAFPGSVLAENQNFQLLDTTFAAVQKAALASSTAIPLPVSNENTITVPSRPEATLVVGVRVPRGTKFASATSNISLLGIPGTLPVPPLGPPSTWSGIVNTGLMLYHSYGWGTTHTPVFALAVPHDGHTRLYGVPGRWEAYVQREATPIPCGNDDLVAFGVSWRSPSPVNQTFAVSLDAAGPIITWEQLVFDRAALGDPTTISVPEGVFTSSYPLLGASMLDHYAMEIDDAVKKEAAALSSTCPAS